MKDVIPGQKIREFVAGCRMIAAHGLVRCSSGNVSCRAGNGLMLIKTSRAWIADMTANDVAICRIKDGIVLNNRRPSAETAFHAGILRARPDVNVVLHFQTPCATTLASMTGRKVNYFVIPEVPFYIGPVADVPYYPPAPALWPGRSRPQCGNIILSSFGITVRSRLPVISGMLSRTRSSLKWPARFCCAAGKPYGLSAVNTSVR
jgi:ribulose-5-phosphate 4-epimerase/fuculose-1-phosphate aldolase